VWVAVSVGALGDVLAVELVGPVGSVLVAEGLVAEVAEGLVAEVAEGLVAEVRPPQAHS
jgi:hypothetical protein